MCSASGERAPYRLMVAAGEASSDTHASHALSALRQQGVDFTAFGMGAGALQSQGMDITVDCRELAVIGIVDVLLNYHKFRARLTRLRQAMRAEMPDLLIIVDYPDFNLKLAETAKSLGIPVLFYISPQVWAWRPGRVHRIGQLVSHMAVLFPFEVEVYQKAGIPVTYVGHPLVDDAVSSLTHEQARAHFNQDPDAPLLTLLPGSRNGEIRRHLPLMLDTVRQMLSSRPELRCLMPIAPTLDREVVQSMIDPSLPITLVEGQACDSMRAADVVLTASGTATLETAMIGTPMVVMYVISKLNHAIMKRMIRIKDIALVNIVAGRRIVPEFVQDAATPAALSDAVLTLLDQPQQAQEMRDALLEVQNRMGDGGASSRVATLIAELRSKPA